MHDEGLTQQTLSLQNFMAMSSSLSTINMEDWVMHNILYKTTVIHVTSPKGCGLQDSHCRKCVKTCSPNGLKSGSLDSPNQQLGSNGKSSLRKRWVSSIPRLRALLLLNFAAEGLVLTTCEQTWTIKPKPCSFWHKCITSDVSHPGFAHAGGCRALLAARARNTPKSVEH